MKTFSAIGIAFLFAVCMAMMGCARDRAGCSSCSSGTNAFSQNSTTYSPVANSPARMNSDTSSGNIIQHKLCPVTGEPLDSMGGAIAVEATGRTLFVCCQGCVKSVKNDPGKYIAIALAE